MKGPGIIHPNVLGRFLDTTFEDIARPELPSYVAHILHSAFESDGRARSHDEVLRETRQPGDNVLGQLVSEILECGIGASIAKRKNSDPWDFSV